jgi:hypothetical protein
MREPSAPALDDLDAPATGLDSTGEEMPSVLTPLDIYDFSDRIAGPFSDTSPFADHVAYLLARHA